MQRQSSTLTFFFLACIVHLRYKLGFWELRNNLDISNRIILSITIMIFIHKILAQKKNFINFSSVYNELEASTRARAHMCVCVVYIYIHKFLIMHNHSANAHNQ